MNRSVLRFLALSSLIEVSAPAQARSAQDVTLTLGVAGQSRIAYLHVPAVLDPGKKYPLVIGYHGGAGNAAGYIKQSEIFAKGEAAGFIVACPQGTPLAVGKDHRVWNSGSEYGAATDNADDVAFTRILIGEVAARYPIDPKRMYATGFSNGGQMCYRLALELSDRIAAIAPMSGGRLAQGSRPAHPVPVLHVHGTADGVYPFEGGLGPYSIGRAPHVPIPSVIVEWCAFNRAPQTPHSEHHEGWESRTHDGPSPVELVLVDGLGHQIAGGGDDHLPHQALRGQPDAIKLALEFFAAHPMP
jgi:polyhydroxybutyrate depolymerase